MEQVNRRLKPGSKVKVAVVEFYDEEQVIQER